MKKLLTLFLVLCMLFPLCHSVLAEKAINLSSLSNDEIVNLLKEVQNELVKRKIEKSAKLSTGEYIGGKDIPLGTYVLTPNPKKGEWGLVVLQNEKSNKLFKMNDAEDNNFSSYITIEEGDILHLPFAYTLTVSYGIKFE